MGWWARFRGRELPVRAAPVTAAEPGETRAGVKQGVWIEAEPDRAWRLVEAIYRDGVRRGPFRTWHRDGFVMERGTFVDGEKDGDLELLDKDGRVRVVAAYRAGKMHGMCRGYDDAGAITYEREYRDGEIWAGPYDLKSSHGDHYSWRKAYQDGHPIGAWEENDYKGRPERRRTYDDDGKLHGPWSTHHEGGAVKLEGVYERDARVGVWRSRAPDGAVVAEIDYGGDATWRAGGAAIDATDDADLERWIELASAWTRLGVVKGVSWYHVERAIDAWPDGDRARACAWIAARIAERGEQAPRCIAYGGDRSWIAHVLRSDDDPRVALVGGIETDHDHWHAEHMARVARRAGQLRVLSLYEVDLDAPADAMFPDGVAWPKLERLSILECGRLGALVSRLAAAPWARAITHLALDDDAVAIDDADAAALISSPHLTGVRDLYLGAMNGGPAFARAIATAPVLAHVEELELRHPSSVLDTMAALAARATPALRTLTIRGEGAVTRATLIGMVAKARHPKLERLELEDLELPDGIEAELARRWPALKFGAH